MSAKNSRFLLAKHRTKGVKGDVARESNSSSISSSSSRCGERRFQIIVTTPGNPYQFHIYTHHNGQGGKRFRSSGTNTQIVYGGAHIHTFHPQVSSHGEACFDFAVLTTPSSCTRARGGITRPRLSPNTCQRLRERFELPGSNLRVR